MHGTCPRDLLPELVAWSSPLVCVTLEHKENNTKYRSLIYAKKALQKWLILGVRACNSHQSHKTKKAKTST